ncbi:PREDICTED: uncharacterized protein LOC108362303 [Rhagoletis zephyria]|uniref:uncharacterized protein LOC108362303 n=1 Tax=Rhagoletis zephyria TaxID=28612 RepID=UPI0008113031|nr:PREDICTED: uncharacterized protein LOC108362303 [Rhagoletis zephyria]
MPKSKRTEAEKLRIFLNEHQDVFKTDGRVLFCKACNKAISHTTKFLVEQHLRSQKHIDMHSRSVQKSSQSMLPISAALSPNNFCMDLCEAFIAADIPLGKLNNPHLNTFLKKYTSERIPSESALRKTYIDKLYAKQLERIKSALKGNFLWVSVDETTDIQGRFVANVIVGVLHQDPQLSEKKFLLNVAELERTNYASIARTFNDSLKLLGDDFEKNKIRLFLSDAAPYMVKAAKSLNIFYPKLLHVTCLAHAIHRVAEEIRSNFKDIDLLVCSGKR